MWVCVRSRSDFLSVMKELNVCDNTNKEAHHVMYSVKMLYIANLDPFFHMRRFNNQNGSSSLTSSNAENKLYHRWGMCHTKLLKINQSLIFYCSLMSASRVFWAIYLALSYVWGDLHSELRCCTQGSCFKPHSALSWA